MLSSRSLSLALIVLFLAPAVEAQAPAATAYKYIRVGNAADANATPRPGYALMGGGTDLDEAFQWLCNRAAGGDFLILRATGADAYNPYIQNLCKLNSVATLIIPSRVAAADPFVAKTIAHASALFLAGGDQANYINFWMNTPVQTALNDAIKRGIPIGGTSAGLAVLGEYAYSAQGDKPDDKDLDSKTVLADPFNPRITLVHGFLNIPILKNIITDTHFAKRDRMGRLLVFLARLSTPNGTLQHPAKEIRGLGIQERASVLLGPDGDAKVVGYGAAYFLNPVNAHGLVEKGSPLSFRTVAVQAVPPGHSFNLKSWSGDATRYTLSIENGILHSTQANESLY